MVDVEQLKSAVESLPSADYQAFRDWFIERDHEEWDRELERDSESGRLDFLVQEGETKISDRSLADL